ncbi:hypothetical protein RISK_000926 [Rhodopirellula islandica]|uniref:Uncharacterized protein n=1 Tax=Rhodopirellula islandica TaxID=595434 RepID=A0A0J1BKQ7_RHOIS|nr:hypothetical protein RISK_000926 [Rhodopirellula islandica]
MVFASGNGLAQHIFGHSRGRELGAEKVFGKHSKIADSGWFSH